MKTINEKLKELFEQDEELFNTTIEELDSYNGYLGDDRYYSMYELNEFFNGSEPIEMLNRAYFGRDDDSWHTDSSGNKIYDSFNPNREHFTFNGYGNLVSSDYKDYTYLLDDYFIESLIENYLNLCLDDEIIKIIETFEEIEELKEQIEFLKNCISEAGNLEEDEEIEEEIEELEEQIEELTKEFEQWQQVI